MRLLAGEARAAGRDPATDPIPGLRRDVLFASTADEEAGGLAGAGWVVREPTRMDPGRRLPQRGRRRLGRARRPALLPDPGRREGLRRLPPRRSTARGATARCRATTMPSCSPAEVVGGWPTRPGPADPDAGASAACWSASPRRSPSPAPDCTRAVLDPDPARSTAAIDAPVRSDVRPGRRARCCATRSHRTSSGPGSRQRDPGRGRGRDRRPDPARHGRGRRCEARPPPSDRRGALGTLDSRSSSSAAPVEAPVDYELYRIMAATIRDHDPAAVPVPIMAPFATDAKYTGTRLGIPTYGFSPAPAAARGPLPRALPRGRRARLARRPPLRPARPLRRRPPLLRLSAPGRLLARRLDQAAAARDGMGRQRGDAHRDERPLGRRHRPQRGQELVGPGPVDDPQERPGRAGSARASSGGGPRPRPALDEPAADEPVDEPRGGRRASGRACRRGRRSSSPRRRRGRRAPPAG